MARLSGSGSESSTLSSSSESESASASLTPADVIIAREKPGSGSSTDILASDDDSSAPDSQSSRLRHRKAAAKTHSDISGTDADTEDDAPARRRTRIPRHRRGDSRHRKPERQHLGKTLTSLSSSALQVGDEGIDAVIARLDHKKRAAEEARTAEAHVAKLQKRILKASSPQHSSDSSSAGAHKKDKAHSKHQLRIEKLEFQLLLQQAKAKFAKGEGDLTEADLAALNTDPEFRKLANQSIRNSKFDSELYAQAILASKDGKPLPPGGMEELMKTQAGREALAQMHADKPSNAQDARKAGIWSTIFLVAGWLDTQFNSNNDVGIKAAIFIPLIIIGLIYIAVEKKFFTPTLGQNLSNNIASNEANKTTSRFKNKGEVFSSIQQGLAQMTQVETA